MVTKTCAFGLIKAFDILDHRISSAVLRASSQVEGGVQSFLANHSFQVHIDDIVPSNQPLIMALHKALLLARYRFSYNKRPPFRSPACLSLKEETLH